MPFLFFAAAFVATYFIAKKMNASAAAPAPKQLPSGPQEPQVKPSFTPGDVVNFPIPGTGNAPENWKPSIGGGYGMPQPKFLEAKYVAEPTGVPGSYFVHVFGQPLAGKIASINMDSAVNEGDPTPPGTIGYGRVAAILASVGDTSLLDINPGTLVFVLAPAGIPSTGVSF